MPTLHSRFPCERVFFPVLGYHKLEVDLAISFTGTARLSDLEYQDWARLQGRGPHTAGGHGCNRHVGWQGQ